MNKTPTLCLVLATVFLLLAIASPTAQAQFSVLHTFTGGGDGGNPEAGVTYRGGTLYGTTSAGGTGYGTVYETFRSGSNWFTLPIYLFHGSDGANPAARVVFGPDGHLYGTTMAGGIAWGVVFDLIPPLTVCKTANCSWKENVLYRFPYGSDGAVPGYGDLTWDQQHNIYGTTVYGGAGPGYGTAYELTCSGNNCTDLILHGFSGPDGAYPENGVIFDPSFSNLFGTTSQGGVHSDGEVFELTAFGNEWLETNAYNFQGAADGRYPFAGVVMDASGDLFGATTDGGMSGGGTVFELTPSGDTYSFILIYSFTGQLGNECGPWASLTLDTNTGDLYGTTKCDGVNGHGNIFKLTKVGDTWIYTDLYDFMGGNDGANPISNVTIDPTDGKTLYGTASGGGSQNVGVVWMIKQ